MSPSSDPMNPTADTRKHAKLKIRRATHLLVQGAIFLCTKYISTGKYTTSGQKFNAPNTPRTSLKYGNDIAIPVVDTTYSVLKHSLKGFN